MTPNGKTVLITGAASGIGRATAVLFARNGARLLLADRNGNGLEKLAAVICQEGGSVKCLTANLAVPAERERLMCGALSESGTIDILVNCAGFCWYGRLWEMPDSAALDMLSVNAGAVVHLSLQALRHMMKKEGLPKDKGHIINIGSITGKLPCQGVSIYSATKAFIDSFTSTLYRETRGTVFAKGTGVSVSLVRCGPVRTNLYSAALERKGCRPVPGESAGIPPERVAAKILSLVRRPRKAVYAPWYYCFIPLVNFLAGWLMDLAGPVLLEKKK